MRNLAPALSLFSAFCLLLSGCSPTGPTQPITVPPAPTASAKFAYVANDSDSTISMYTVSATGVWTPTSPATIRTGTEPETIVVDPQGKFAYCASTRDNTVSMYAINQATGVLTPLSPATVSSGAFPQDFTFTPNGNFAYSANSNDDTVTIFSVNKTTGQLTSTGTVPVPGYNVSDPVAVTVNPAGSFLYVAAQYIEVYSINAVTGGLTLLPEGYHYGGLRGFKLTFNPTGQFVYSPDNSSSNVYGFSVNATTGALTDLAGSPFAAQGGPAWVTFDPSGQYAYISNRSSGTITNLRVGASAGTLSPFVPARNVNAGASPWPTAFDPSGQILYVVDEGGSVGTYAFNADGTLTFLSRVATGNEPASMALVP